MKLIKIFLSFPFFLLFAVVAESKDSAEHEKGKEAIFKEIDRYNELTQQYAFIDLDSCFHFHEIGLALAKRQKDDEKTWECFSTIIKALYFKTAYKQAKIKIDQASNQLKLDDNPKLKVKYLLALVDWHWRVSNLAKAQEYLNEARALAEKNKYWKELGDVYKSYGLISLNIPELKGQLEAYYYKAIEAFQVINDTLNQAKIYNNLSYGYNLQENYGEALSSIDQALALIDNDVSAYNFELMLANRAEALIGLGQVVEGFQLIEEGMGLVKLKNNKSFIPVFYELKSKSLFNIKDYEKAIEVGEEGLEFSSDLNQRIRMYDKISMAHQKLKNFKQSFDWAERSFKAKDELLEIQKNDEVVKLQMRYEVEKKEAENQVLSLQNKNLSLLVILLIIFSLTVIAILLFLFKKYQQKNLDQVRQTVALDLKKDVGAKLNTISKLATGLQTKTQSLHTKRQLTQLVKESTTVAHNMTDVIWALEYEETEWKFLLEKMEYYLNGIKLVHKEIDIIFEKRGLNESSRLPLNVRHHLLMIFKEAINNIQKHTVPSLIKVELSYDLDVFNMRIRNEFEKRIANSKSTGRGLMNIKRRVNELKGEVFIKNEEGYFDLNIQIENSNQ